MPYESKLFDYNLPKEFINQNPYKNPNNSKLLIADSKKIISFKKFNTVIKSPSLFILNKSTVRFQVSNLIPPPPREAPGKLNPPFRESQTSIFKASRGLF